MFKKGLIVLILLSVILSNYAFAEIVNLQDTEQELDQIQSKIEDLETTLERNGSQKKSVIGQLASLDSELSQIEAEIAKLDNEIEDAESVIGETVEKLEITKKELKKNDNRFKNRARSLQKVGNTSYLAILMESDSVANFLTRITLIRKMIKRDNELIEEMKQQKQVVEEKQAQLEIERQALLNLQRSAVSRKSIYESRKVERSNYLNRLRKDSSEYAKALDELEETSKKLEQILKQAKAGRVKGTGTFTWPAPDYYWITSPYGYRTHPVLGSRRMHTGIDVGVPYGQNIVASDTGTVTHAGILGGYGKSIIIDHGNGKATLYAHASRLLVQPNEVVPKGKPIAKCGTSGWSTGPHLHFEVRVNGSPQNPLNYVKKR